MLAVHMRMDIVENMTMEILNPIVFAVFVEVERWVLIQKLKILNFL